MCAKTRELVFSFSVPCAGCTSCSLPAEVHVSKFDMVEFPYCAGYVIYRYIHSRWGWVFLEQTWILSGIQFTTHFIKKIVVETKRFVSSFVLAILTRQTCGQRSSKAAENKRRALANGFFERICNMFLMSKCRGD